MSMKYAIENYLDDDCTFYTSSEDDIYVVENVYNKRPSKPFRFTGIGVAPYPEYICVELPEAKRPNFTGIFNHNLTTMGHSGDLLYLQACLLGCEASGGCDWDQFDLSGGPGFNLDLVDRLRADFNNLCQTFDLGMAYQYFRWAFSDSSNDNAFIEIGELFLGRLQSFNYAKLQPGRADGPRFFEGTNITSYGQIWSNYLSESDTFQIEIMNKNDPTQISELRTFIKEVRRNDGKFIFIPNDRYNFCYYVYLENLDNFNRQIVSGEYGQLYSWNLNLRTLTAGIALVG